MKIIFLNSYSPRTGHNFVAQVLKIVSDAEIIPHNQAETRLSLFLESYHKLQQQHFIKGSVKDFLDSIFVKNARERILKDYTASYLLIKDTNHQGVSFQKKSFPDDIHFLMFRDPRDTLISIFKGMRFYNEKGFKAALKKIGFWSGLYSYYYSWNYSRHFIKTIPGDLEGFFVIRYEDLVKRDKETLKRLIQIFNSNMGVEGFITRINEISVINTSFHKEETGGKHIWDSQNATSKFNPVNRKNIPFLHRKGIELGSKKFRKKLGYI
ncbi:sulfotransferase [Gramella jeungdoensis]|uniref:Sulfotransferase n=1 Tax=Gramella jeungdoensis TaxID=708091 RepID=A0ABT0Z0J3_9FLAO|nr:sulfotransferase [Gramella jeungdoensis]MCM8569236.1 sulfotransferase [Gramella jeungdoensis]